MEKTPEDPKTNTKVFITLIAGGIFLAGAAIIAILPRAQENALNQVSVIPAKVNYPAPAISLTDLAGKPVALSDYAGEVILVNNWATWCPPCKSEMPALQAYYSKHSTNGFVIVAIESGEPADTVRDFVETYQLTFPVWLDMAGKALEIFDNFNLPSSYVINRQGMVSLQWTGPISQSMLEKYVTPLLEK